MVGTELGLHAHDKPDFCSHKYTAWGQVRHIMYGEEAEGTPAYVDPGIGPRKRVYQKIYDPTTNSRSPHH